MAVVLPQGRFNNSSDQRVREFIMERCRLLAVVGVHDNTFKPHTGTKTSVLFVQKWNDDPAAGPLCPKEDDYNIFFATQRLPSKDNRGDKIYVSRLKLRWFEKDKKTGEWTGIKRDATDEDHAAYKADPSSYPRLFEVMGDYGITTIMDEEQMRKKGIKIPDHPTLRVQERAPWFFSERLRDDHGHWVVQHDFFNHDGKTQGGIAEAFHEFAAKEKLSFF